MLSPKFKSWVGEFKEKYSGDTEMLEVISEMEKDPELDFMISAEPSFWSVIRGNLLTRGLCMEVQGC